MQDFFKFLFIKLLFGDMCQRNQNMLERVLINNRENDISEEMIVALCILLALRFFAPSAFLKDVVYGTIILKSVQEELNVETAQEHLWQFAADDIILTLPPIWQIYIS